MTPRQYCVYILTNKRNNILYTGITGDIQKRIYEHKTKAADGFTKKYNVAKLVYYEIHGSFSSARRREKQIKGWLRRKKAALIESVNPYWVDLAQDWIEMPRPPQTLRPGVGTQGDRKVV